MSGETSDIIEGVQITPLRIIDVPGGDVLHAMKCSDLGFSGFGEAYFSTVSPGVVKAWKRHRRMALNLVVPVGHIRFVIYDDRPQSPTIHRLQQVTLGRDHYCRLTVPPMVWMGFQGVDAEASMLLNVTDIEHDSGEMDRKEMNEIKFDWERQA